MLRLTFVLSVPSVLREGMCPMAPVSKNVAMCIVRSVLALQEQVDVEQCKGIFPYGLPIVEVRITTGSGLWPTYLEQGCVDVLLPSDGTTASH